MKKKIACILAASLLAGSMSGAVYAEPEKTETTAEETKEEESESAEETEAETKAEGETEAETEAEAEAEAEEDVVENPEEDLKEALEKSNFKKDVVIAEGVSIGKTDVSGMTPEEALKAALKEAKILGGKAITISLKDAEGVEPIMAPISDLGLHTKGLSNTVMEATGLGKSGNLIVRYKTLTDLQKENKVYDLDLCIDKEQTKALLESEMAKLSIDPVNAEISFDGSSFTVSESKTGIKVDEEATLASISEAFVNWNQEDVVVEATAEVSEPERTTAQLSRIKNKIGTFSTSTSSASDGKLVNLRTGMRLTTGTLIMPGETWSMHSALSPFNAENGYTVQIAYQNGGYVQEYGGGICQLATTLYNAALLAELNITARDNHSMTVGYTYPGLDATINDGGSKDLKLTNDYDFPVYIVGSVGGGSVTYSIYGEEYRPANRTLRFYGEYTSYVDSGVQRTIDYSLAPGQEVVDQATSYPAATAVAYKEIYIDGVLSERITLHTDKYRASPSKVRYNPTPVTPATPAPTPAPETPAPVPETPAPETPAPAVETPAPTPAPETPAPAAEAVPAA